MVVNDGDLVFKLMSLPSEARAELLFLLGGPEAIMPTGDAENARDRFFNKRDFAQDAD